MTETLNIRVEPRVAASAHLLEKAVAQNLALNPSRIKKLEITRRSIDARQRRIYVNLTVRVHIDIIEETDEQEAVIYNELPQDAPSAIIVGAGPTGLFAALRLIELGIRPVILERGKDVDTRRKDVAKIARTGQIDPDSNYCFGEGGAGTFSDGKLYTRSTKRGDVTKILRILHQHGAAHDILVDAHPHIGTNRLPEIIKSIRHTIERCRGVVHFDTRVTGLVFNHDKTAVTGVETLSGQQFLGPVILATGHSARDVYRFLNGAGVDLQPKGIAVGVRLEHPARLIDCIQYHSAEGRGKYLPTAEYSMLTRVDDRAVYSFCMCPGGVVVPAATAPGQLVVNGMSAAARNSRWSNSAMVVEVLPEDVEGNDVLRMMHFQEQIESVFSNDANGAQNAAAQRMTDFVTGRPSRDLPPVSYAPGVHPSRIDQLLPHSVARRLQEAFRVFGRKSPGFLTDRAVLIGAETRTSSPVRIPRDPLNLCHITVSGLYPAGEGAGYAGGIVSAAIDGERCADAVAKKIFENN